jgi:alanine racemase
MVLNPEQTSYNAIIQHGLEPEIYSLKGLQAFIKTCQQKQIQSYPIHLKLDTGMHRLGFNEFQIDELINIINQTKAVSVRSILSHMATSDDPKHLDFSLYQIKTFETWTKKILEKLPNRPIIHLLNTSGISNFPEAQYDMVRLGIGLYGVSNDSHEQKQLAHVATLKSIISQIRTIEAGESVGYGRTFVAKKTSKIATIPIGYADGIRRNWGKCEGYVLINQQKAPIVGSICMDMLMVDVSDISCIEGNAVIIFGENPTIMLMAEKLNTIPYEILTSISQRVKRIYFRE